MAVPVGSTEHPSARRCAWHGPGASLLTQVSRPCLQPPSPKRPASQGPSGSRARAPRILAAGTAGLRPVMSDGARTPVSEEDSDGREEKALRGCSRLFIPRFLCEPAQPPNSHWPGRSRSCSWEKGRGFEPVASLASETEGTRRAHSAARGCFRQGLIQQLPGDRQRAGFCPLGRLQRPF